MRLHLMQSLMRTAFVVACDFRTAPIQDWWNNKRNLMVASPLLLFFYSDFLFLFFVRLMQCIRMQTQ